MRIKLFLAAIAWFASVPALISADVVFTNPAAFQAAGGYNKTFGFEISEGFPAASSPISSFYDGQVGAMSPFGTPGPASIELYPGKPSINQVLTGLASDGTPFRVPLTLTFKLPRFAIGFDDMDLAGIELATVQVTHVNGDVETHTFSDDDNQVNTPVFFGVTSPKGIKSLTIYAENPLCDALFCFTPNSIDNLHVTIPGDLDASGKIDADDYFLIDRAFANRDDPKSPYTGYANGDVDFNGLIDADDYFLIDKAYVEQLGNAALGLNAAAVPEPDVFGLALVVTTSVVMLGRRLRFVVR